MPDRKDFNDVLGFMKPIVEVVATTNEKDPADVRDGLVGSSGSGTRLAEDEFEGTPEFLTK